MRHEEAWKRLPDLLDDRDDSALLAHVSACADCQRQLFLLGRIDRLLRDGARTNAEAPKRRPARRGLLLAAAGIAAACGLMLALVVPQPPRKHELMRLRTPSGQLVGEAKMGHSDARNVTLALNAHGLPVRRGHVFLLWAADQGSSMQVGRFMVDRNGGCRVRFNLPGTHGWSRFWVTEPGRTTLIAST